MRSEPGSSPVPSQYAHLTSSVFSLAALFTPFALRVLRMNEIPIFIVFKGILPVEPSKWRNSILYLFTRFFLVCY